MTERPRVPYGVHGDPGQRVDLVEVHEALLDLGVEVTEAVARRRDDAAATAPEDDALPAAIRLLDAPPPQPLQWIADGLRRGDLSALARRQYARAQLVPDARRAIWLPRHPQ